MNLLTTDIIDYLFNRFNSIKLIDSWGEKSIFYNPDNSSPRGTYFCTIKEKDGENDKASWLNREGVFRLNFGISKLTFLKLFGEIPKRPCKGKCIEGVYDFTSLNTLMPHPIYGWMSWISVLNPSETLFCELETLISESYELVLKRYQKK